LLPADRLGVVVLTNAQPIGVPEAIALSFLDFVHYGKPRMDWFATLKPFFEQMNLPPYGTEVDSRRCPTMRRPALHPMPTLERMRTTSSAGSRWCIPVGRWR
jgi:hypothetical protein